MSGHDNMITVTILERTYKVKCPPNQAEALHKAARYLDAQMRKLNQSSPNAVATDTLAVVAALNISHQLMECQQGQSVSGDLDQRVQNLEQRIEQVLENEDLVEV